MSTKVESAKIAASADTLLIDAGADGDVPADTVRTVEARPRRTDSASPAGTPSPNPDAPPDEPQRGDSIGRFVVLGKLGEGGMGLVLSGYDPKLDRKVAIKLLRTTDASSSIDAGTRLLREAQAMAKINHPNVIAIHEVGTFRDRVYLAMEFAGGGTVHDWLGAARRSRREILDVFIPAGRGLVAAHAAGLIHRDFKPDNLLLTSDGTVRVTDFGIVGVADEVRAPRSADAADDLPVQARALIGSTPISQQLTRPGEIMGTPIYMAPEQFLGLATTARADQFSFCASLYDALYGERPFASASYEELEAKVVMGRVSPPPRGADVPGWLRRALIRGLSPAPEDRYPSMEALLTALTRDPVTRTRRVLTATGAVAAIALTTLVLARRPDAATVCSAGAARFDEVWNPARLEAMRAAFDATNRPHAPATFAKLTTVVDAWGRAWKAGLVDACEATYVRHAQSEPLLDRRLQCLDKRLADTRATVQLLTSGGGDAVDRSLEAAHELPSVAACADGAGLMAAVAPPATDELRAQVDAVRARLAEATANKRLGRSREALASAHTALTAATASKYLPIEAEARGMVGRLQLGAADPAATATLRKAMHEAMEAGDERAMVEAATYLVFSLTINGQPYDQTLEVAALAEAASRHTRLPAEATVMLDNAFGVMLETHGHPAEARVRFEQAVALAERELGPDSGATAAALNQLGNLLRAQGQVAEARKILERVLARHERVFGSAHPQVASASNNLGIVYRAEGKLDQARALYERALAIRIASLGPDHPEVGNTLNNLGAVYSEQGDSTRAEQSFAKALALWETAYGRDNVAVTTGVLNLANVYKGRAELDRARALYERARKLLEAAHGPDHPMVGVARSSLGAVAQLQGRLDEAQALLQRAVAISEQAYGPDHVDVADSLTSLALVLQAQGKVDQARAAITRSLAIVERAHGTEHPRFAAELTNLGQLQRARKDLPGALESYRKSIAIFERRSKDHANVSYPLLGLGSVLTDLGRAAEAVPPLERALAIRAASGMAPSAIAEVRYALAQALAATPGTRDRALAEATTAASEYDRAERPESAAELRRWLRAHR